MSRTPLTWVSVSALPEDTSHPMQPRDTPAGDKRPAGDQPTRQETIMLSSRKTRGVNAGESGSEAMNPLQPDSPHPQCTSGLATVTATKGLSGLEGTSKDRLNYEENSCNFSSAHISNN